jgi:hypothetical protein
LESSKWFLGYSSLFDKKSIFWYELVGMVVIILLGSMLHFTFEWSSNNPSVGIFSAVNESVWEHLKIAFWPFLLYLIFEYRYLNKRVDNFFLAKVIGVYFIILIIPVIFYSYTAFFEENLIIDIGSFIFAVIVGQLISYKLFMFKKVSNTIEFISLIAIIILGLAFVIFTFYPPQVQIFQDPITGGYGLVNQPV